MKSRNRQILVVVVSVAVAAAVGYLAPYYFQRGIKVDGYSMSPTLFDGDSVVVNPAIIGPRIYTDADRMFSRHICLRAPGYRKLRAGDIVIMNGFFWTGVKEIFMKPDLYLCKRCIGCPGDTISILNGHYVNSNVADVGTPLPLQDSLSSLPADTIAAHGITLHARYSNDSAAWTIKELGPLYIPGRGDVITMDRANATLYEAQIQYETGYAVVFEENGDIRLAGKVRKRYRFRTNWYFVAGDNVLHSNDSRYFGLVPEAFVDGVVNKIY